MHATLLEITCHGYYLFMFWLKNKNYIFFCYALLALYVISNADAPVSLT